MSEKRLIDANALSERLKDLDDWCQDLRKPGIEQARCMVHEAPTIDAVEVVRCRDCIHAKPVPAHAAKDFTNKALSCEAQRGDWKRAYGFSVVAAWGYCNEGERKEPDHE